MRTKDKEQYFVIFESLLSGINASKIAKRRGLNKSTVSKKIKNMVNGGILIETVNSGVKIYARGPKANEFFEQQIYRKNHNGNSLRGGIDSAYLKHNRKTAQKIVSQTPNLDYFSGRSPRIHNIIYRASIENHPPIQIPTVWKVPNTKQDGQIFKIEWVEYKENPYNKTPIYTALAHIYGWSRPAKIILKGMKSISLQISLPASYVLEGWVSHLDYVHMYFDSIAANIRKSLLSNAVIVGELKASETHKAFEIPLFRNMSELKSGKVSETVWVDRSMTLKGHVDKRTDIETQSNKTAQNISRAVGLLEKIPTMYDELGDFEDKVYSIERTISMISKILSTHNDLITAQNKLLELHNSLILSSRTKATDEMKDASYDIYQ